MYAVQTSAPASEPVTLAEAKAHLRVDVTDEDTLITAMIVAARTAVEHIVGRKLITQSWSVSFDSFDELVFTDLSPIASVTSVKYTDTAGVEQTLANTEYALLPGTTAELIEAYGKTFPDTRNEPNAVRVVVVVGYGDAASVPQAIKQWLLVQIATMFDTRSAYAAAGRDVKVASLPYVDSLLDPYRVWAV